MSRKLYREAAHVIAAELAGPCGTTFFLACGLDPWGELGNRVAK